MGYTNFENLPSQETPFSSTVLKQMQVGLMEMVFPIGSTYITQENTNPSTILEFGEWERVKGKVLVGLDENDAAFNTMGKTGGEKTHEHTLDYAFAKIIDDGVGNINISATNRGEGGRWSSTAKINNAGGSVSYISVSETYSVNLGGTTDSSSNLQPYQVVGYMWIRTA